MLSGEFVRRRLTLLVFLIVAEIVCSQFTVAEEPQPAVERKIDFARDIQPIFKTHCSGCHGAKKQESSYRLDVKQTALAGGDFGDPAIIPGNSADSPLIKYVSGDDPDMLMPPEGEKLKPQEIALLRAWIDQGAVWPRELAGTGTKEKLTTQWWSFQPLSKAAPPQLENEAAVANPIDAFILAKLREKQLSPSPPAERPILARRLYLDMHGLLPTVEQLQAFLDGTNATAYATLVDQILESPRYGERWARHWLDVVRFAETDGFEMNQDRPRAYHYRDYVIAAFNDDKPYDKFVYEQLAGDALGVEAATGFLVGGAYDKVKSPDINLTLMQRQDELADMINTTSTTFLGLTVGCARCHNHKFDPILQTDYYSLQAVFAGVKHGERPLNNKQSDDLKQRLETVAQKLDTLEIELTKLGVNPPVNSAKNIDRHDPVTAKFVRFTIEKTNNGAQPCLDELEIWTAAAGDENPQNVALASLGAKASSSGNYPSNPKHKLEHIHDGRYGNSRSWISDTSGSGWVQIELAKPFEIDRIVWGRDREGKFDERVPTGYRIEFAVEPDAWSEFSSSSTRLSTAGTIDEQLTAIAPKIRQEVAEKLQHYQVLGRQQSELETAAVPAVYAGVFEQPAPTHRLYRGDPQQKREEVNPDALEVIGSLELTAETPEQARRAALAEWITRPENPLTARVMVNRIWQLPFRHRTGCDSQRFRRQRRPSDASRIAGLASWRIYA